MIRLCLSLLLILSACAVPASDARVLVAGDSVLAWNEGGVARALSAATGADVESRAVSGAWVDMPGAVGQLTRFRIVNQVPARPYDWVVVNGGANDLILRCGCGRCRGAVDHLIARDGGSGAMPRMWRRLHEATGARLVIVGYYNRSRGTTRFSGCRDGLAALDARAARFAAATPWAVFVDAGDVVTPAMLAADDIHPGPDGSAAIARLVAGVIAP